jgi:hypothetical protein
MKDLQYIYYKHVISGDVMTRYDWEEEFLFDEDQEHDFNFFVNNGYIIEVEDYECKY